MKTALAEPEIVTKKGKPVSVILPINQYQRLAHKALNFTAGGAETLSAPREAGQPRLIASHRVADVKGLCQGYGALRLVEEWASEDNDLGNDRAA